MFSQLIQKRDRVLYKNKPRNNVLYDYFVYDEEVLDSSLCNSNVDIKFKITRCLCIIGNYRRSDVNNVRCYWPQKGGTGVSDFQRVWWVTPIPRGNHNAPLSLFTVNTAAYTQTARETSRCCQICQAKLASSRCKIESWFEAKFSDL